MGALNESLSSMVLSRPSSPDPVDDKPLNARREDLGLKPRNVSRGERGKGRMAVLKG